MRARFGHQKADPKVESTLAPYINLVSAPAADPKKGPTKAAHFRSRSKAEKQKHSEAQRGYRKQSAGVNGGLAEVVMLKALSSSAALGGGA